MSDNAIPYTIEDDELDLLKYVLTIWRQRKLCVIGAIVGVFIAVIITFMSPKEYRAQVTFLMPSGGNSVAMNSGFIESYLGLNAGGGGSQFGKYIEALLSSYRLKVMVAKDFQKPNEKIEETIARLQITHKKIKLTDDMGLYSLSFSNKNKKLAFSVLNSILKNLQELTHIMELDVSKELITILDHPQKPISHYKPDLKKYIGMGFIGGLLMSILVILIKEIRHNILNNLLKKN